MRERERRSVVKHLVDVIRLSSFCCFLSVSARSLRHHSLRLVLVKDPDDWKCVCYHFEHVTLDFSRAKSFRWAAGIFMAKWKCFKRIKSRGVLAVHWFFSSRWLHSTHPIRNGNKWNGLKFIRRIGWLGGFSTPSFAFNWSFFPRDFGFTDY